MEVHLGTILLRRLMSIPIPYLAHFLHYEILVLNLEFRSADIYLEDIQDDGMDGESILHIPFSLSYTRELQFFQAIYHSLGECSFEKHPFLVIEY